MRNPLLAALLLASPASASVCDDPATARPAVVQAARADRVGAASSVKRIYESALGRDGTPFRALSAPLKEYFDANYSHGVEFAKGVQGALDGTPEGREDFIRAYLPHANPGVTRELLLAELEKTDPRDAAQTLSMLHLGRLNRLKAALAPADEARRREALAWMEPRICHALTGLRV